MEHKLERKHWEQCKIDNSLLILQSKLTILMAERVLILADEELAKFPEEVKNPEKPVSQ